jgi:L-ascorbate metabolism protein UlaG (beta-lactamase superfamily)
MRYTLLRNATALLNYGGRSFLIDPMLDPAEARPAIPGTPNPRPNPLVELPAGWRALVDSADSLLVTHLHQDHFDTSAAEILNKQLPLLGQPDDVPHLTEMGFTNLLPIDEKRTLGEIELERTPAQHGRGAIADMLAPVSGFVFRAPNEPVLYLAGDTIWYPPVLDILERVQPEIVILNASGARFLEGDPIVMTVDDVAEVHRIVPKSELIVVHLEAINHCLETRADYRSRLPELGVTMERIYIPEQGETFEFPGK